MEIFKVFTPKIMEYMHWNLIFVQWSRFGKIYDVDYQQKKTNPHSKNKRYSLEELKRNVHTK